MKKFVLSLSLGLCIFFAQAQIQNYQRVLIKAAPEQMNKLFQLGLSLDHSFRSPQGIQVEISEDEVKQLQKAGIPHEVLISDMTRYYQDRNKEVQKEALLPNCNFPLVNTPNNFHLGSMGGYFTLAEMENILDSMKLLYPNLISTKQAISSTQSIEGRNIWYVKISDNPGVDENEPEVLYTALHHAREPESLSQLIFYMWYLLENYNSDPEITALVNNRELFFVPCLNPDGYVYNETISPSGGGMWRKNRRQNSDGSVGVDLNRNYGQDWGFDNIGSSPTPSTDVYRGPSPFSEPETQAIQSFCNSRQFVNALNAHTFGNHLIYPWGHIASTYTPDKNTYESWGHYLVREHRYSFGTCNETLNYLTNGDSDSWMYGEQTSKSKILAMTPETGGPNDGFWPASNRIVDLCKTTFAQNIKLARLAGTCVVAFDEQDKFISGNGYLRYRVKRLGLSSGTSTLSITPVAGFSSVGPPKTYSNLSLNQEIIDSIACTIAGTIANAQQLQYSISVNNDGVEQSQLLRKWYGNPLTVFYNDGSNTSNFDLLGTWGIFTNSFVSAPSCITESPLGNYGPDDHKTLATKTELNLTTALVAHLQYYTRFRVEKSFDQVTLEVSTNNGATYAPLCANYESPPVTFDGSDPVYDGRQDEWAKEDIDLAAYLGQKIKLRLKFDSDFYDERDGFYLDDFLVRVLQNNTQVGLQKNSRVAGFEIFPNPSKGAFTLRTEQTAASDIRVYNSLGQTIDLSPVLSAEGFTFDLSGKAPGLYFVQFSHNGFQHVEKLILEN